MTTSCRLPYFPLNDRWFFTISWDVEIPIHRKTKPSSLSNAAKEPDLVCKALDLVWVLILGHSWRSMLAVDYMLRNEPSGVRSLIFQVCLSASRWSDQRQYISELPEPIRHTILEHEANRNFSSQ